ncbi:MAG: undecaprenyl-diphosphate phosphatase [Candidatus Omnitrophica bacterium]|nr:undecaprenyl-diphosphate phosphatase [Candidatus Omnitrophota bacterium]
MLENIVLGLIQGIAEWLPLSSDGLIVLAGKHFFNKPGNLLESMEYALFLHLGTFFAALIYFRKDVFAILKAVFAYPKQSAEVKKLFQFLCVSTLLTGILGVIILKTLSDYLETYSVGNIITALIGFCLIITAFLQIKAKPSGFKGAPDLKLSDAFLLGVVQAFAPLPGLSRSGLTISTLFFLRFEKEQALRISYLMSLPVIFLGNIALAIYDGFSGSGNIVFAPYSWLGLLTSFVVGIGTINILFGLARKINFGYFLIIFGILTLVSSLY